MKLWIGRHLWLSRVVYLRTSPVCFLRPTMKLWQHLMIDLIQCMFVSTASEVVAYTPSQERQTYSLSIVYETPFYYKTKPLFVRELSWNYLIVIVSKPTKHILHLLIFAVKWCGNLFIETILMLLGLRLRFIMQVRSFKLFILLCLVICLFGY